MAARKTKPEPNALATAVIFPGTAEGNRQAELDVHMLQRIDVVAERLRLVELSVQKVVTAAELRDESKRELRDSRRWNWTTILSIVAIIVALVSAALPLWLKK